ncbi:hypothetical protein SK128_002937 [Halocaridina rubra]|uniref:ETS domain-containing protein n=1 Tax=Halocaridina rubra TaxID=373956 RepID=A0AAN8XDZ2_HALRR
MYPLSEFHQGSPKLPRFRHLQEENGSQSFQTESYHVRKIHNHGKQALNPLKRSYDSEHPQDLSISSFPKCRASSLGEHYNRHSHNRYKESEEQEGTDRRVDSVSQENNKDGDDKKSDLSDHSQITSQTGTFQDLIAADETPIKEEPQDIEYEYDVKSANLFQDVNCVPHENNDFEKPNLKIYNGNARECDSPKRKVVSPMDQREGVVLSLSASDRYPSHHASHLKKELLRPTSQVVIEHSHQTNDDIIPQSIPHPVIALRESLPQVSSSRSHIHSPPTRRDPPPLVKLLPKLSELMGGEDDSIEEQRIQRSQSGIRRNSNSHLLVSAPPTYHSHFNKPQNPHHFTLEIHNQQLGQVFVNGGSHLDVKNPYIIAKSQAMKSKKSINLVNHISNDGPLNLSGHNRKSPIALLTDDVNAGDDPFLGKILTNRKKRLRGPKSWEFLVRLLKDPTTNPTLIRWENKDSGVFRLVQPSVIAQRWGRRTGKHASENLTYENFARGLRYHYATGALKPVSEKSFVYRLGPKALKLLEDYDSSPVPFL